MVRGVEIGAQTGDCTLFSYNIAYRCRGFQLLLGQMILRMFVFKSSFFSQIYRLTYVSSYAEICIFASTFKGQTIGCVRFATTIYNSNLSLFEVT